MPGIYGENKTQILLAERNRPCLSTPVMSQRAPGVGSEFGGDWDENVALGNRFLHFEATVGQCTEGRHASFSHPSPGRKALEGAARLASSVQ